MVSASVLEIGATQVRRILMTQNPSAQTTNPETPEMLSRPTEGQVALPLTSVREIEADGVQVFYRAAGDPSAPVVLLLHGFPTSSFMFRELIPRLATDYRVLAPDLPGFGFTEVPAARRYVYSFDAFATTIEGFTGALHLDRYAL